MLLVPVIPFALFGEQSEAWFQANVIDRVEFDSVAAMLAIAGALAADILLPVPSSAVMTFSGSVFGVLKAAAINWVGLSCGSVIGYGLGCWFGKPLLRRLTKKDEAAVTADWLNRFGPWMLAALRGLPVLAEASVMIAGVYRMSPWLFWPPVLIANAVLAVIFASLGHAAKGEGWLGMALILSIILPLVLLLVWLSFMQKTPQKK